MGKNKKKNKSKSQQASAAKAAAAASAAASASSSAPAPAPVLKQQQPPPPQQPPKEHEKQPAAPPAAAIEAEEEAPASPPVQQQAAAAPAKPTPVPVTAQEPEAPAIAPATTTPVKAAATAAAEERMATGEHAHLGPRSPPHLKADVAKGFVQGGVFTLRLLEAEEHQTEKGQPYTTYAFRAYWGPELLHAKPWVVRRRYSEFRALDAKLRAAFPEQACKLLPLPPKTYPALLSWLGGASDKRAPEVIARRKQELEAYLNHIVANIPPLLRSPAFDEFMHLTGRIERVKAMGAGFVSCPPHGGQDGDWDIVAGV